MGVCMYRCVYVYITMCVEEGVCMCNAGMCLFVCILMCVCVHTDMCVHVCLHGQMCI